MLTVGDKFPEFKLQAAVTLEKGGEFQEITSGSFAGTWGRLSRLVKPATNKVDFELFCPAVSAINACEARIRAHEKVVLEGGLGEDAVHDAIRIAATVQAAAVALEIPAALAPVA